MFEIIREVCFAGGICVTISPTTFIYMGGEEEGYEVGLLNYPRFPETPNILQAKARTLALRLLEGTHQHSILNVGDDKSEWISRRPQ